MKKLIALTLLLCTAPLFAHGANAFSIEITLTRGERSRDSNSATILITISGETLAYIKTYGGRLRGRTPESKDFTLTNEDQRKLIELIKNRKLLRTEAIGREQKESGIYRYFALSIRADVDGKKGFIQIKGSRKAADLKEEKLYKDAIALIEEIYGIIHRADEEIVYEPLIQ